jgi:adenosine kinase
MTSLICGSLAFDTIMAFPGRFSESILADQLHKINVAFLTPSMRREYGGCAGNIAYNLKMLGGEPTVMATIGMDGEPYLERLAALDISSRHIRTIEKSFTAQAFITTDIDSNQITAFHPGAMALSHQNRIEDIAGSIKLAIVAPDGRDGMVQNAEDCAKLGIPFVFDPGQGLPMFSGPELAHFIDLATYVAVNDYEAEMLAQTTGLSLEEIAKRVSALIVTRGERGAEIFTKGEKLDIPCVEAEKVVDPTGCGDAFRAGLIHGLTKGMDIATSARLGSLMGALKIAQQGGQNHFFAQAEIEERFNKAFGYRF